MAEASLDGEFVHLQLGGLSLAARRSGRCGATPILALHGWMDNSASFSAMTGSLSSYDPVCLDFAGHGQRDPRPHLGVYHILPDVAGRLSRFSMRTLPGGPHFHMGQQGRQIAALIAETLQC